MKESRSRSPRARGVQLQEAVYRIAQAPDQCQTLNDLYRAIHAIISDVMPANNFYISIYDERQDLISFPYFVDEADTPPPPMRPRRGLTEYVLRTGQALLCNLTAEQELRQRGEIELVGAASPIWLGVPLKVDRKTIGVMAVQHYSDGGAYGERERQILEFVSSQVARAIERKLDEQELKRRADQFAALFETASALALQGDLPTLLQTIVEHAITLLCTPCGFIYLFDAARGELELTLQKGLPVTPGLRLRKGEGIAGLVAQTLQPLIVDDYAAWGQRSAQYDGIPYGAVVEVPMLYSGELIGVLGVSETGSSARKFNEAEARLLSLFAGQAASAVHNARLLHETRNRAEQLALLYDAGLALNSVLEPEAQLKFLFNIAIKALQADRVEFFRQEPASNRVRFEIGVGHASGEVLEKALQELPIDQEDGRGLVGWVAKHRLPLYLPDVLADPRYIVIEPEIRSALWVPVEHVNQLLGVLGVFSTRVEAFAPQDERLLVLFANQAAVALENARLYTAARQELTERKRVEDELQASLTISTRFYQLSAQVQAASTFEETARMVTRTLRDGFAADAASIQLCDSQGRQLFRYGVGLAEMSAMQGEPCRDGLTRRVLESKAPVIFDDPSLLPPPARAAGVRSGIAVPLGGGADISGVLFVDYCQPHAFSERELELFSLFAYQTAFALKRVRLMEETRQRLSELEAINKISTAVRAAQTLDEMLPLLLDETLGVLGTTAGQIAFYDAVTDELRVAVARGWFAQTPSVAAENDGIAGRVYATGRPYISREFRPDPVTSELARGQIPAGWGGIVVPIRAGQEIIGVFNLSVPLPREVQPSEVHLLTTIAEIAGNAVHRMRLHESLEESYLGTVMALAKTIDARDAYTNGHSERLAKLAQAVAHVVGMSPEEQEALLFAARLHDIGKIGVPDAILRKPAPLDEDEWKVMRQHPVTGADIIQPVRRLCQAAPLVRHHHERFDGTGYPDGLSGETIPLGARVLAVVDAFSAMTDDRVYRKGLPRLKARSELERCAGTQFDPELVRIFLGLEPQFASSPSTSH
jgi:GAF domain-containing protein